MINELPPLANFIIMGFFGGLVYGLVMKYGWKEKFEWLRRIILGAIIGALVYILGLPNHATAFFAGYMGTDFIEALVSRWKPPI